MIKLHDSDPSTVKNFLEKNLEFVVLSFLYNKPMMGFEIIKSMVRKYGLHINQGKVYTLLKDLERRGIIKKERQGKIKVYSITQKGQGYFNKIIIDRRDSEVT